MHIIVLGLSHKTAPIEVREKITFPAAEQAAHLDRLLMYASVAEAAILSTCNRTELYAVVEDPEAGRDDLTSYLVEFSGFTRDELAKHLYSNTLDAAVHHLFRVVSSLDSMVLGEAQIQGQIKECYSVAMEAESTGVILNKLFATAIRVGKRARSETAIGESALSISSVAVELAMNVFEDLKGRSVLIIGAGEMSELTAQALKDKGVTQIVVANRTYGRAEEFARKFGGRAARFDDFTAEMRNADIVISSTGAAGFVLTKEMMADVMRERKHRNIFLVDIAVPRDIAPDVDSLSGVFLYNIDDLQAVIASNLADREREAVKVETIIDHEVGSFAAWLGQLEIVPTIAALKKRAEAIRTEEVEKTLNKMPDLSDKDKNEINALAKVVLSKILHEPIVRLKEHEHEQERYRHLETVRYLFDLPTPGSSANDDQEGKKNE
jgi:glutamyl-tRNA reductase